jgi:outer membrane lipoprotein SlyB
MTRKWIAVIVVAAFAMAPMSCANIPEEHKGATTGAAVGAAAGTLAGMAFGSGTKAALTGAILGAVIGGVVGHYYYDQKRSREQTAQAYGYQPTSGTMLRIESAGATPTSVKPGQTVDLQMTYAVLTPDPNSSVAITESREIRYNGQLLGRPEVNVSRTGGTYTSSVPIVLASDAKKGTYTVLTTVRAQNVSDSREFTYNVM